MTIVNTFVAATLKNTLVLARYGTHNKWGLFVWENKDMDFFLKDRCAILITTEMYVQCLWGRPTYIIWDSPIAPSKYFSNLTHVPKVSSDTHEVFQNV